MSDIDEELAQFLINFNPTETAHTESNTSSKKIYSSREIINLIEQINIPANYLGTDIQQTVISSCNQVRKYLDYLNR